MIARAGVAGRGMVGGRMMAAIVLGLSWLLAASAASAAPITPGDSGLWVTSDLQRQGVNVIAWPEQADRPAGAIATWYTYEPGGPGQVWLITDVITSPDQVVDVFIVAGAFPGLHTEIEKAGTARLWKAGDRLRMQILLPVFGGGDCDPRPRPTPDPPACTPANDLRLVRITPNIF